MIKREGKMKKINNVKDVKVDKNYWLYSDFEEPQLIVVREVEKELNRIRYQRILDNGMTKYERKFAIIGDYNSILFEDKKQAFLFYVKQAEENILDAQCILSCASDSYKRNYFEG